MEGLVAGRIVYYVFDQGAVDRVHYDRQMAGQFGHPLKPGDVYPAMVVRVLDGDAGLVNLTVMLDGPDTFWATSVPSALMPESHGTWHWMFPGQDRRYDATAKQPAAALAPPSGSSAG